jgi:hypothetical protein
MEIENINSEIKSVLLKILSIDENVQEKEILRVYDSDCHLENSYLVLQGRPGKWREKSNLRNEWNCDGAELSILCY